jgi:flagellar FliL protein
MADDVDDQDMSFAEGESEPAAAPKAKGAGPGILKILMIVGIALGAVILIVTVVVITVGVLNKQQKPMSAVPITESYQAHTPIYNYVGTIGEIRTKTRDKEPSSVLVKINLGFEDKDEAGPADLQLRLAQVRDFLRNYFATKYADQLVPEEEKTLKSELKENLNNLLSKPAIKDVLFEEFNVVQM